MPKRCDPCLYYTTDAVTERCPRCGRFLTLTFLAAPGDVPPPIDGVPDRPSHRVRNDLGEVSHGDYGAPPSLLSGFVRSEYRGVVVMLTIVGVVAAIVGVVTTR